MRDIASGVTVFHSGSSAGGSQPGPGDTARSVRARKRPHAVQVRFADHPCEVGTLEGVVNAATGDAIVTGIFGERWPVGRDCFNGKYEAVSPLTTGSPGNYLSLPVEVVATQMHAPFEVVLADGRSRLQGQVGDWLVDHGDGNLGIVNAAIFAATYEIGETT